MNIIKKTIRRLVLGYRADQDSYVRYLKKIGVKIGENIEIFTPANTFIDNTNPHLLTIGSNVSITGPSSILTHDYSVCVTKKYTLGEILGCQKKTVIGDNVFIGWGACILPGAVIGNNTIIGAYSVVCGVLESDSVYAGNPAKKICSLNEYYAKRKSKQLSEAVTIYSEYMKRYNREPHMEIFHEYFYLFMGKKNVLNNSIPSFFENKFYDHGNYDETKSFFYAHDPYFDSFEQFLEYARKNA
jgi:acetyltransferase-like isoleucine patch superfamily enzyme